MLGQDSVCMQAFAAGADGDANQAKTAHYNAQMRQYFSVENTKTDRESQKIEMLKMR